MLYETVPSRAMPGAWLAEAVDYDSEGEIYSALFYGQEARRRAHEYAANLNSRPVKGDLGRY